MSEWNQENKDAVSPLIKVQEASTILSERPPATYDKIAKHIFPDGVIVRLGPRSYRFHRQNLMDWLGKGGAKEPSGNGEPRKGSRADLAGSVF